MGKEMTVHGRYELAGDKGDCQKREPDEEADPANRNLARNFRSATGILYWKWLWMAGLYLFASSLATRAGGR